MYMFFSLIYTDQNILQAKTGVWHSLFPVLATQLFVDCYLGPVAGLLLSQAYYAVELHVIIT